LQEIFKPSAWKGGTLSGDLTPTWSEDGKEVIGRGDGRGRKKSGGEEHTPKTQTQDARAVYTHRFKTSVDYDETPTDELNAPG
jgi:hypothetical protein